MTSNMQKLACLTRLLLSNPSEVWERVATIAELRADAHRKQTCSMQPVNWSAAITELSAFCQVDVEKVLQEPELAQVEQDVTRMRETMPKNAPFGAFHHGDLRLARICYALARIIRPPLVVETGVCYGVTSAFLLKALNVNGGGVLHSIDLPPLGKDADQFVGRLIPNDLRSNWKLHRGASKKLLPAVLRELGPISFFVHDSLHTYSNMKREFETVAPFLAPSAVVVSDDIEGNEAFPEWIATQRSQCSVAVQEESKQSLLGVALFRRQ
jgi:hypothetical protein